MVKVLLNPLSRERINFFNNIFFMKQETKEKLDYFVEKYNNSTFIEPDPIGLVHRFLDQKDM